RGNQKRTAAAREAAAAKRRQASEASVTETATTSVTEPVTGDEGTGREGKTSSSDEEDVAAPSRRRARMCEGTPRAALERVLSPEIAQAVIEHRQKKKAPLTVLAAEMLAADFEAFADPNEAARFMIKKGWQAIDPTWTGVPPRKPSAPSA